MQKNHLHQFYTRQMPERSIETLAAAILHVVASRIYIHIVGGRNSRLYVI